MNMRVGRQNPLNRRDFLVMLTGASFTLITACSSLSRRRRSELDEAIADLESALKNIPPGNNADLLAFADSMRDQALAMRNANNAFAADFNKAAVERSTAGEELSELATKHQQARANSRNAFLQLQDELHAAVPDEYWSDILDVLNRRASIISPTIGSRS